MVCNRCIASVKSDIEKAGLELLKIELGEAEVKGTPSSEQVQNLNNSLKNSGFEIIDNRKSRLIEQIKNIITDIVQNDKISNTVNLSSLLSQSLNYEYNYLSNLFSEVEGITIERYLIAHKIEKIKELLMYDELTLSQIADKLGYSSVAYLSNQFKKETGLTPSFYKSLKEKSRRKLDEL